MENFEEKKQKAILKLKNRIQLIQWAFMTSCIFFVFSVFHEIWFFNKISIKLLSSSFFLSIIILVIHYVYKKVEQDIENLKQK